MPPFKTLLAASLLLISCLPGAASAGLYSSDKNNFGILKTNLTDASKYRYAALVSTTAGGDDFETLHQLARVYAEVLEKDMGVLMKMCEALPSRKQTAAFKEFLEALQKEQPYIASTARLSQHRMQANAEQSAEDARRADIDRKALARKAEQVNRDNQQSEDVRSTIRVVRLTHANDTPNQAFTVEYDRCLALRAKKRA